jgi:hypothetical protein
MYMGAKKNYRERSEPANKSLRVTRIRGCKQIKSGIGMSSQLKEGGGTAGWMSHGTIQQVARGKLPIMAGSSGMKITHAHIE